MICKNCGSQNSDNVKYCESCGSALNPQGYYNNTQNSQPTYYNQNPGYVAPNTSTPTDPGKGFAIAAMVCGIVSFFCAAVITGTLGIIFGGVAKSKGSTSGMATAGIVCGAIGIALWLFMLIACNGAGILGMY